MTANNQQVRQRPEQDQQEQGDRQRSNPQNDQNNKGSRQRDAQQGGQRGVKRDEQR